MPPLGWLFDSADGVWRFLVAPGPAVILGRRPPADGRNVRIAELIVARQHLRIEVADGGCTVEDANSHCGIAIDGERVAGPRAIAPGTRVQIAGHVVVAGRPVAGARLDDLLGAGPLPWREVRELLGQIGRQLAVAHAAGRAHHVFTPHDLVRLDDGAWVLVEPGWPEVDDAGRPIGSLTYAAPDVDDGSGQAPGPAADVYVLGLVAFEALAGRRPFWQEVPQQEWMRKLHGAMPDWERAWDPGLRELFTALLVTRARHRITAAALVDRIEKPYLD